MLLEIVSNYYDMIVNTKGVKVKNLWNSLMTKRKCSLAIMGRATEELLKFSSNWGSFMMPGD